MPIPFCWLAVAILAVWLPHIPLGRQHRLATWFVFFVAALISGWSEGYLSGFAIAALASLTLAAAVASQPSQSQPVRIAAACTLVALALGLALHRLPGFHNPVLVDHVRFSSDAVPTTQYANFDKGAVGLILLAFTGRFARSWLDWRALWARAWPIAGATVLGTLVLAWTAGMVRLDVKLGADTLRFLAVNLLFTCMAEEAFFRGVLQEWLTQAAASWRTGRSMAVVASAIAFGLSHAGGGARVVFVATALGAGCAIAYARTRRIEAPILTHFTLNAAHFIGFTYPQLTLP